MLNVKNKSVAVHDFAMTPKPEIPRSAFPYRRRRKMTANFSTLYPFLLEEVLPGDHWRINAHIVARTATPIVPLMDNWHIETQFFAVPWRILWTNFVKFMGEQDNPGDSTSYVIPKITSPAGGFTENSLYAAFGVPFAGQVLPGNTITINALPLRAYNAIYNQWYRDENLQNSQPKNVGDGPDNVADYSLLGRGKRPDYFTQALPWPQKGNTAVSIPLGGSAPILPLGTAASDGTIVGVATKPGFSIGGAAGPGPFFLNATNGVNTTTWSAAATATGNMFWTGGAGNVGLYADLTAATAATINQLRTSFAIQKQLEREARGGTRYVEWLKAVFGVTSPDFRLQRPEYIGGGHLTIDVTAIPQTSATGLTGATTPIGTLAAAGTAQGSNGLTYAATEHAYIIGIISGRSDITYQQGMRKLWSRNTKQDLYVPAFAGLGEQVISVREIYCDGSANDALAFGYQPRWDEYRSFPSEVTGFFNSRHTSTLDYWHTGQKYAAAPALNAAWIFDDASTLVQRNFAAGAQTSHQELLLDIQFEGSVARALPAYGVPGFIDRF